MTSTDGRKSLRKVEFQVIFSPFSGAAKVKETSCDHVILMLQEGVSQNPWKPPRLPGGRCSIA